MRSKEITRHILSLTFLFLIGSSVYAQSYNLRFSRWEQYRHEFGGSVGLTAFLGELGGANAIGSDGLRDWNFNQNKLALSADYQYYLKRNFSLRANLMYAFLSGDDKNTTEPFRSNRNLHFRSTLIELSGMLQFYFMREEPGSKSHFQKQPFSMNIYGFIGVGVAYFNPKAKYDGKWVNLQPLGTEGQGIEMEADPYSLFTAVIPIGFGLSKKINGVWMLGLEFSYRKTFTDYLDDVSTVYYNNDKIFAERGEMAAYLADPSNGYYRDDNGNQVPLNSTGEGMQRGDPEDKDAYLTGVVTVRYFFGNKGRRRTNRSRF